MIKIVNQGQKELSGRTHYKVIIWDGERDQEIAEFYHDRVHGLGDCLLQASKAVERKKWLAIADELGKGEAGGTDS